MGDSMVRADGSHSHRGNPPDFLFAETETGSYARGVTRTAGAPALLERESELARISGALSDACAGRGAFIVVEGPSGIGKTAVLAAAREEAEAKGMRVLRARGSELEHDFAFGLARQLLEPVLAEGSEDERTQMLQGAAAGAARLFSFSRVPAVLPPSDLDPSFAILHGLYWLCATLAAEGPVCVVVDDLHWGDAPSLRFLAFLVTRLDELPMALLVATRPDEPSTDPRLLASVTGDRSAQVIELPGLTSWAVSELVLESLGEPPEGAFVEACIAATRGTPFLLRELLDALATEGIAPTAEASEHVERIGARPVGRSIRLRLERLPETANRLARALAVLEESELVYAALLADLEPAEAAASAELLAVAGILEAGRPLRFVHPIVRRGVYAVLTERERARAHGRAAKILAETAIRCECVAEHLLESEPAADDWVVDQLVDAAVTAREQGARDLEATFLRRALEEPPPSDRTPAILYELGMAEASAGLDGWEGHLQGAMDTATDPVEAARAGRALGRALNRVQRYADAVVVLDRAASGVDPANASIALELEAAAVVVGINLMEVSPSVLRRRTALRAVAESDPAVPPAVLAAGAFVSVLSNEPAEIGGRLALLAAARITAARDGDLDEPSESDLFTRTALSLLWADWNDDVAPLIDDAIGRARVRGYGGLLSVGLLARGWLSMRKGELRAAEADARTALAAAELPAAPMHRLLNGVALVMSLVEQGELDSAQSLVPSLSHEAASGTLVAANLSFARAP
jgi:hypothetical protein